MECEHAHDTNSLRQGDIFAAHPGTANWQDPWRRFGIIISADCDLAQGKTGPNLVFVPIVGLHTYLKDVWLPLQVGDLIASCEQKLEKTLKQAQGRQIAVRHAIAWSKEQLIAELGRENGPNKQVLENIISLQSAIISLNELYGRVSGCCGSSGFQEVLGVYFDCYEKLGCVQKPGPNYRRSIISNALNGLAQKDKADTWPIIDIVGLDPEMREEEKYGFVSDMRRFSVAPVERIVLDRREWMKSEDLYLRVCRLGAPYKSDFLQKFSLLFTRVGLDDRRMIEQKILFDKVSMRIMPDE